MKRNVMFSMRMPAQIRDLLDVAAKKEYLSVSSLLLKISKEYLEDEGFLPRVYLAEDRRRFPRKPVKVPAIAFANGKPADGSADCVIRNISQGGVLLTVLKRTATRFLPKEAMPKFRVSFYSPEINREVSFSCHVRHINGMGSEVGIGVEFADPHEVGVKKLLSLYG